MERSKREAKNRVIYKALDERGPTLSKPDGKGGSKAPAPTKIEALRTSLLTLSKRDTTPSSVVSKIKKIRKSLIVFQAGGPSGRFASRLKKAQSSGEQILSSAAKLQALRNKAKSERANK